VGQRRVTRPTNGFSKKVENHAEYARPSDTTPLVQAGVSDLVWSVDETIALLEQAEATPIRRGSYAKTRQAKPISD
jgi:hypothetical protein